MSTLIYAGVVIAGAVTLIIDAYKNYEQSLNTIPFREYKILENVQVSKLCSRRERNIGFVFYSLLYLVTYAVVLSSAELYTLLQSVAQSNAQIGPPDELIGVENDPLNLIDTQYGKPIFVSATIIALFSIGAFRPVENTMRSLAHRLAGVPRGVYAVIEDLQNERFEHYATSDATPLFDRFEKFVKDAYLASTDADQVRAMTRALRGIDYLAPTVMGQTRVHYFPMIQLASMHDLSQTLEHQIHDLRRALEKAPSDAEKRAALFARIQSDYHDTIAVLAVHFLRNNRAMKEQEKRSKARRLYKAFLKVINTRKKTPQPVADPGPDSALDLVYRSIKRGYRVEHNSYGMGLLFAFALSIAACYSIYFAWNWREYPIHQSNMTAVVKSSPLMEAFFAGDARVQDHCAQFAPQQDGIWFDDELPTDQPEKFKTDADDPSEIAGPAYNTDWCAYIWKQVLAETRYERRKALLEGAFWVVLPMSIAVAMAAIATIFGREVRHEDSSWPTDWTLRQIPFLRLFAMAIVPALVAVLGVVIGLSLELLVKTSFQVTEKNMVDLITSQSNFIIMHLGVGFLISLAVLMLVDRHEDFYNEQSLILAALFALCIVGWYFLVVFVGYSSAFTRPAPPGIPFSFEAREAYLHAAPAALFILCFAFFLEVTEDQQNDKGWWVLRKLGFYKARDEDPLPQARAETGADI